MKRAGFTAVLVVLATTLPASGQLMLPGAVHTLPPEGGTRPQRGSGEATSAAIAPNGAEGTRLRPPSETTLVGRDLARDGRDGTIQFRAGAAKDLEIAALTLAGETIESSGAPCRVEVVAGEPIVARFVGRSPDGLSRYDVEIAACPFSFVVLEGAALVSREPEACTFVAAACRVDPTGLWGPRGDSIDSKQVELLERARARAEAAMRAGFRALLASAGKDREAVKAIAGEQAGFSSQRSMACRTYAGEEVHGFCALRLTEARAVALQARNEAVTARGHKVKAGIAPPRGPASPAEGK